MLLKYDKNEISTPKCRHVVFLKLMQSKYPFRTIVALPVRSTQIALISLTSLKTTELVDSKVVKSVVVTPTSHQVILFV